MAVIRVSSQTDAHNTGNHAALILRVVSQTVRRSLEHDQIALVLLGIRLYQTTPQNRQI